MIRDLSVFVARPRLQGWALLAGWLALAFMAASCGGGDPGRIVLSARFEGLPDLGPRGGSYEGWLVVRGVTQSTGKFVIDASRTPARVTSPDGRREYGTVRGADFGPSNTGLGDRFPFVQGASLWFVTIEPAGDLDGTPSPTVILAGRFNGERATLDAIGDTAAGGPGIGNFSSASGSALITSATGGSAPDQGVWFVSDLTGTPSLSLQAAPAGFEYEAWVERGTERYSLGRFQRPDEPDRDAAAALSRGALGLGFRTPGQDFVVPVPARSVPVQDLANGSMRVEITLEPDPDTSVAPFPYTLLSADIPMTAVDATTGAGGREIGMLSGPVPPLIAVAASPTGWLVTTRELPRVTANSDQYFLLWARTGAMEIPLLSFVIDPLNELVTSQDGATVFGRLDLFGLDAANTGLGAAFPNPLLVEEMFLTVEPALAAATDPAAPAALVAGDLDQGTGVLSIQGSARRGVGDLSFAAGRFLLRSPSDDDTAAAVNDRAGIWFRRSAARRVTGGFEIVRGLELPLLRPGWRYEGWVVDRLTGQRFSTGKFDDPSAADEDAATSVAAGDDLLPFGFDIPGQDFVRSGVLGAIPGPLAFDASWSVVVSLEPLPDTSPAPFLELLRGPLGPVGASSPPLANQFGAFPTGFVSYNP